jgi:hypothetical protein
MPPFVPPQLCKRVGRPPAGEDRVEGGQAVMRTRKGLE